MGIEFVSPIENWRDVVGFETIYQVSNLGRVRRIKGQKGTFSGRILKPRVNRDGYTRVELWNSPNKPKTFFIHVLVLEAFVGKALAEQQCCHNDGIRNNNILTNLRWGTAKENAIDRKTHGNQISGETHPLSRLTKEKVDEIRHASGSQRAIARLFGVSQQHVSDIKRGKRWVA